MIKVFLKSISSCKPMNWKCNFFWEKKWNSKKVQIFKVNRNELLLSTIHYYNHFRVFELSKNWKMRSKRLVDHEKWTCVFRVNEFLSWYQMAFWTFFLHQKIHFPKISTFLSNIIFHVFAFCFILLHFNHQFCSLSWWCLFYTSICELNIQKKVKKKHFR